MTDTVSLKLYMKLYAEAVKSLEMVATAIDAMQDEQLTHRQKDERIKLIKQIALYQSKQLAEIRGSFQHALDEDF